MTAYANYDTNYVTSRHVTSHRSMMSCGGGWCHRVNGKEERREGKGEEGEGMPLWNVLQRF